MSSPSNFNLTEKRLIEDNPLSQNKKQKIEENLIIKTENNIEINKNNVDVNISRTDISPSNQLDTEAIKSFHTVTNAIWDMRREAMHCNYSSSSDDSDGFSTDAEKEQPEKKKVEENTTTIKIEKYTEEYTTTMKVEENTTMVEEIKPPKMHFPPSYSDPSSSSDDDSD